MAGHSRATPRAPQVRSDKTLPLPPNIRTTSPAPCHDMDAPASRDHFPVSPIDNKPPSSQLAYEDLMRACPPWITLHEFTQTKQIVDALEDVPIKWTTAAGRVYDPRRIVKVADPVLAAQRLRKAYDDAPSTCLHLWFGVPPEAWISYEVKTLDVDKVLHESALNEPLSHSPVKADLPVSAPTAGKQTIDDVVALYPGLDAVTGIKLMRIIEGLGDMPVQWVPLKLELAYPRCASIRANTEVDAVVHDLEQYRARNAPCRTLYMAIRYMPEGSWALYYASDYTSGAMHTPREIAALCPLINSEQSIAVGQIDGLLADVPHVWGPVDSGYSFDLGSVSVREIVSGVRSRYRPATAAKKPTHHVRLCCVVHSQTGAVTIRYEICP